MTGRKQTPQDYHTEFIQTDMKSTKHQQKDTHRK